MYAMNCLSLSLHDMLCGSVNSDLFVNSLFNNKKCVICEADIEFCYLNQIAGPRLKEWKDKCPLYIGGNEIGYIDMRTLPDQWSNKYILILVLQHWILYLYLSRNGPKSMVSSQFLTEGNAKTQQTFFTNSSCNVNRNV